MPSVPSTSQTTSPQIYTINHHSRRILLHSPLYRPPTEQNQVQASSNQLTPGSSAQTGNSFDANVVMILAVLLCALICALGLNSIVRCALRCSSRMSDSEPEPNPVTRLTQPGLRRKALQAMPILIYSAGLTLNAANPICAICLSDFESGERVRVLPKCNHGFHVRCIDRWLIARSSCPTCRRCMFGPQQKSSGCSDTNRTVSAQHILVPLEPEGLTTPYNS
ncbi:RING-H2 finger protein ATL78 [Rhynchospora pubera]|uniref:RING-H2 finger protein ATL78 n=1 Tax=Rhynchospora pubera TaxID=906938 RepID=A0AAV8FHM1_9POAL|nr:RING-H2 finger protein ATL78 [Rhynchospora pubera]